MLTDMPLKMAIKSLHCKTVSFSFHGRSIVMNKGRLQHRNQRIVAGASLYHPFVHVNASNMPWLSAFEQIEFIESPASECPFLQLHVSVIYVQRSVCNIFLRTGFPSNISPAHQISMIKMFIGIYFIEIAVLFVSSFPYFLSSRLTSLKARFPSFNARHPLHHLHTPYSFRRLHAAGIFGCPITTAMKFCACHCRTMQEASDRLYRGVHLPFFFIRKELLSFCSRY